MFLLTNQIRDFSGIRMEPIMSKFSQFFRRKPHSAPLAMRLLSGCVKALIFLVLLLCAVWASLVLWIHLGDYVIARRLVMGVIAGLFITVLISYIVKSKYFAKWLAGFVVLWLLLAAWFACLPAKQDRPWQPEVSESVAVTRSETNPNLITLHNVRDFDWMRASDSEVLEQPMNPYYHKAAADKNDAGKRVDLVANVRWTERTVDLSKLSGVDIINSYWMGEAVGHTLLSFRFEDERPLSFSIEIRKEVGERFSTIGGGFKEFEMTLVAAEERDIVYTRTNVRGEQVYLFPVEGLTQQQVRALFLEYVKQAEALQQKPSWYNTLTRNCTTVLFDMARKVAPDLFPRDYRILASGYVPNYLYDEGRIASDKWDMDAWYKNAHINPKIVDFSYDDNRGSYEYSKKAREGLLQAALK